MRPGLPQRRRVFAVPLAIAVVTLAGLLAGLIGDGAADWAAWFALGLCVGVIGWGVLGTPRR